MRERRSRATSDPAPSTKPIAATDYTLPHANSASSHAVSWWPVHEFVVPVLERTASWPTVGTPEWCELPADHPAKIAALFDAARHHALRLELNQEARAQAAKDVAASEDWAAVAQRVRNGRSSSYIPRLEGVKQ